MISKKQIIVYTMAIGLVGSTSYVFANEEQVVQYIQSKSQHGVMIDKRYVGINDQKVGAQLEIHCIYPESSNCNLYMNRQDGRSNLVLFSGDDQIQSSIIERNGEIAIYTDYPNGAKRQLVIKQDGVYLPDTTTERLTDLCKIEIDEEDRTLKCTR